MAQPRIELLAAGFGSLDQTVKLNTGRRAFGRIAEQPVLSFDHERASARVSPANVETGMPPVTGDPLLFHSPIPHTPRRPLRGASLADVTGMRVIGIATLTESHQFPF